MSLPQTGGVAEGPWPLRQEGLEPLGSFAPHALARGVGPRGPALQTCPAPGLESVHDIAHGLFAAPDLARTPRPPGALRAGQHELAAPHDNSIGGPESSLHLLALL